MRPFKPIPEFEHLSPDQLEKINDLIRSATYAKAQREIEIRYGIKLSINKLFRYLHRLNAAEEFSSVDEELTVSVNDYVNLLNGKPVPFSAAGKQVIQKRAFELACAPNTSPSLLKDLFRIFTYEDRHSLAERKFQLAERIQKFREDQANGEDEKVLSPAELDKKLDEILGTIPINTPNPNPNLTPSPDSHEPLPENGSIHSQSPSTSTSSLGELPANPQVSSVNPPTLLEPITSSDSSSPTPEGARPAPIRNPQYPQSAIETYRSWAAPSEFRRPSGDEEALLLESLPTGIDQSIDRNDPDTWPCFYRNFVRRKEEQLLDYFLEKQIRVITPTTLVPLRYFGRLPEIKLSLRNSPYTDELYNHGIPWLLRHPESNEWFQS